MTFSSRCSFVVAGLCLGASVPEAQADGTTLFENEIRPLLVQHCGKCHGPKRQRSGLRLDRVRHLRRGGERGTLFDLDEPESGLLWRAVSYADAELEMPPDGKLADAELALLLRWLEGGATLPELSDPSAAGDAEPGAAHASGSGKSFDLEERAKHWAYQDLRAPEIPGTRGLDGGSDPIDALLTARLLAEGLAPAPAADRRTLLRRLSFDLIGLPPTPDEQEAFVRDDAPAAYEHQVDRLLASPRFGERWGRHWLDLMRYAETRGHEFDYAYPNAWQYRDYVIRALDADLPIDELVREHVAGDLLEERRRHPEAGFDESILGTGFWFLGDEVHSPVDIRADETDRLAGKVDTLSRAFLGQTVACARCHDHKFDAISTEDYYALTGYVKSGSYRPVRFETERHNAAIAAELAELRAASAPRVVMGVARSLPRRFGRMADYLRAARGSLSGELPSAPAALDADTTRAWVEHLRSAAEDPADPFHAFALFAGLEANAGRLMQLGLVGLVEEERARALAPAGIPVVDFADARGGAPSWMQNGFAFQRRAAGDAVLGVAAASPLLELTPRTAVYFDETWRILERHPDSEGAPGKLDWEQAGRTLRTRSFVLEAPKLYYLVRGGGHAFAAVDSHRLVEGPLHGAVVRTWEARAGFRWIEHDLSDYVGHRVHVELSPRHDAPRMGIAAIVMGVETPGLEAADDLLAALLARGPRSIDELADAYGGLFGAALADLAARAPDKAAAERINFLLTHPELGEGPVADELQRLACGPYVTRARERLRRIRRVSRLAPAMLEGSGVDEPVLIRGSHLSPGPVAHRRFLEVFGGKQTRPAGPGSGRLQLAEHIVASPLFPRVFVNRVWHHLFGRGLVPSVDDFGRMGQAPSHPGLLDHLALSFRADDHSLKRLIRRLVCTDAYRMSGETTALALERDPTNRLLHHRPPRRLSAEALRDSILAVSGRLDTRAHGPSVPIHLTDFLEGRGRPQAGPLDGAGRRSVYVSVRRNFPVPLFAVFDFPSPADPVGRRSVSNVPAQALTLMNDPFVWQQSEVWAKNMIAAYAEPEQRVVSMYARAFAREPSAEERALALGFVRSPQAAAGAADAEAETQAWRDLGHVLYNAKEFLFVP